MAILAECPYCHKKQKTKNKVCSCGGDLDKAKAAKKVKYWITYRLPDGKQRRESVDSFDDLNGYSIEDARKAHSKRVVQKAEKRILDIKQESKMTFKELTAWYLNLERVKALKYSPTLEYNLNSFNAEFAYFIVSQLKPSDLENYQAKRKREGLSDSYIDQQIGAARTMINKAFDNDLVGGQPVKTFKRVKKLLKPRANKRDMVLTVGQADSLMESCPRHLRPIVATAYHTGMRKGEILGLTWNHMDMKERLIRLRPEDTKTGKGRVIPISEDLYPILKALPRNLHDDHLFLFKGEPITDIRGSLKAGCSKIRAYLWTVYRERFCLP